ncbi:MAG: hypothetical protein ACLS3M_02820 [Collinsella sp.]
MIAHTALVSKHNGQDVRKAAREWGVFLEDVEDVEEVAYALLFSRSGESGLLRSSSHFARRQVACVGAGRVASSSSILRASGKGRKRNGARKLVRKHGTLGLLVVDSSFLSALCGVRSILLDLIELRCETAPSVF